MNQQNATSVTEEGLQRQNLLSQLPRPALGVMETRKVAGGACTNNWHEDDRQCVQEQLQMEQACVSDDRCEEPRR